MPSPTKHAAVETWLRDGIGSGRFASGSRLPAEGDLMRQFGVSRITVTRAMRDLQTAGLVERRVGAGSFVSRRLPAGHSFGLLIPDLGETDIFEPICQGMMASPLARAHALLWGSAAGAGATGAERAWTLCQQYIERGVAGVFFAPLEFGPDRVAANDRLLAALDRADIAVVLLDRTVASYPDPGRHDLVALDNRRAGYVMTRHLLALGCRRVVFVAKREAATGQQRDSHHRAECSQAGLSVHKAQDARLPSEVAPMSRRHTHLDQCHRHITLRTQGGQHAATARHLDVHDAQRLLEAIHDGRQVSTRRPAVALPAGRPR